MSTLLEDGVEVLGESVHVVMEKVDSERFTVTMKENNEESFLCDVCGSGFNSKKGVKQHLSKMHGPGKGKVVIEAKPGEKRKMKSEEVSPTGDDKRTKVAADLNKSVESLKNVDRGMITWTQVPTVSSIDESDIMAIAKKQLGEGKDMGDDKVDDFDDDLGITQIAQKHLETFQAAGELNSALGMETDLTVKDAGEEVTNWKVKYEDLEVELAIEKSKVSTMEKTM